MCCCDWPSLSVQNIPNDKTFLKNKYKITKAGNPQPATRYPQPATCKPAHCTLRTRTLHVSVLKAALVGAQ